LIEKLLVFLNGILYTVNLQHQTEKMKKKFLLAVLVSLAATVKLLAQAEPEITISLLANDKIAEVNINQDKFIKGVGEVMDLMKAEFKGISKEQKIALLLVNHKVGKPTIELYSKPKIDNEKEQHFLKGLGSLNFDNTKLVDFPILLNINIEEGGTGKVFSELVLPMDRARAEYKAADLKNKYELNKKWAIDEALPVLAAYENMVDKQFVGVKNLGALVSRTDFSVSQNLASITSQNADYWRATLEMGLGNQIVPATKICTLISQGQFDHAMKYLEIVNIFSDPKSIANSYLAELAWRLQGFNEQLNTEINKGVAEHDKGNYQNAINNYNSVLASYPNSAWALYELYYSQNALEVKKGKIKLEDRSNWDKAKINIFKANPLYNMDVRASNAKEGYLLFRRQEISKLFKSKEEKLNDVYKYADIAMDLGVHDFAAQLFWYSFTFSKGNDKALNRFLYCMEQLGIKNLKQNFKGDFEKLFKEIEAEKEKEMKTSDTYKAFKE
jgi:tetratricopeptide (TPR) repeat protein